MAKKKTMKIVNNVALWLAIIATINIGLTAWFGLDIIMKVFSSMPVLLKIVNTVIAASGVVLIVKAIK